MWERCAQSQGFGIFGPRHAGGGIPLREGGGGVGEPRTGIIQAYGLVFGVCSTL